MQTAGDRLDRGERYKSISILLSLSSPTSQRCFLVLVAGGGIDFDADGGVWMERGRSGDCCKDDFVAVGASAV
jgi:hypothetical protein